MTKGFENFGVSSLVPFNLLPPVIVVRFGKFSPFAIVPVPETSMDKDRELKSGHYDIGSPWEVLVMELKSIARTVENSSDG